MQCLVSTSPPGDAMLYDSLFYPQEFRKNISEVKMFQSTDDRCWVIAGAAKDV